MSQQAQGDHSGYQQERQGYVPAHAAATATEKRVIFRATEVGNYDLTSGNDLAAFDEKTLYEPATPLAMAAGDYIAIQHEKVGTGLDVPDCNTVVVVDFNP